MNKILLISLTLIIAVSKPCFCEENSVSTDKFLKAIDAGDINTVKQMLQDHAELVNARREGHKIGNGSALDQAIRVKNKEIAVLLLSKGADVNDVEYDTKAMLEKLNALHAAASWDFAEIIPVLISYGANPNQLTSNSGPPLAYAKKGDVVRELIKGGAQVNLKDKSQRTPLYYVCQRGSAEAVQALIDAGSDVNAVDSYGLTPLYFAVGNQKHKKEVVELLIAHGADINTKSKIGRTLLKQTLEQTNEIGKTEDTNVFEIAKILIANGAEYSIEDVARIGDKDKVRELLDKNPKLVNNQKALLAAIYEDNFDVVKLFVEQGADLNPNNSRPPLHAAVYAGHMDIIRFLIVSGANVNLRGKFGETPLHWAALHRPDSYILDKIIIAARAEAHIDSNDADRWRAFTEKTYKWALSQPSNNEIAKILIAAGANVNAAAKECGSAINEKSNCVDQIELQFKEIKWHEDMKNRQVQRMAPPWNEFAKGDTPLHAASHLGNVGLVKMLIAAGANVEVLNDYGQTPLQYAAAFGNKDIAIELLKAGADSTRRTPTGLDAVTIAEKTKNQEIADILKNHTKEN